MSDTRYFMAAAHEQFPPDDLLQQAVEAEEAGFDGVACSDHLAPWWEPGESGMAWVWLGAAAQATSRVPLGTGVTAPVYRYNPTVVAQAFATLEAMYPGRAFLGIGSGESLNESPAGMDWPSPGEQVDRMEEALEIINRLFDGERAASVAGRLGDGIWCLADPELAPKIIDTYRGAAEDAGREPGEVLLQAGFSWAEDDEAALAGADVWRATQVPEYFTEDWHDPAEMQRNAQEKVSDDELRESFIVSSDPSEHAERVREIEELGASIVVLMNISGSDPHGAIRTYGEQVLPALRGSRAAA